MVTQRGNDLPAPLLIHDYTDRERPTCTTVNPCLYIERMTRQYQCLSMAIQRGNNQPVLMVIHGNRERVNDLPVPMFIHGYSERERPTCTMLIHACIQMKWPTYTNVLSMAIQWGKELPVSMLIHGYTERERLNVQMFIRGYTVRELPT